MVLSVSIFTRAFGQRFDFGAVVEARIGVGGLSRLHDELGPKLDAVSCYGLKKMRSTKLRRMQPH